MEPPPIDYAHVFELYKWCTRSKGGGWFFLPSYVFAVTGFIGVVLYYFLHQWAFGLMVVFGFAAWEKTGGYQRRLCPRL